jgi:outer membrane protein TolC
MARTYFHKRFRKLPLACAALLALLASESSADDATVPEVTLGTTLQTAITYNPTLQSSVIDVAAADAAVLRASGIDDWVLDATMSLGSVQREEFGILQQDSITFDMNVTRSFFTGGTLILHADSNYTRTDSAFQGETESFSDTVTATYVQPLFAGRGRHISRAGIEIQKINRDISELTAESLTLSTLRDVIVAYWELAYAHRDLEIRLGSLELAEERLKITQAGIDGGAVAPTEALAVEQIIAVREQEILGAELAVANRSIELRRLTGMSIGPGEIELGTSAPLAAAPKSVDLDAVLALAYEQNPLMQLSDKQRENAELLFDVADNALSPQLDLAVTFGPIGVATNFGDALTNTAKFDDFTFGLSLSYSHAFGQRALHADEKDAHVAKRRAEVFEVDTRAMLAQSMAIAAKSAELATKRMEISQRVIGLAEQNIAAEQARFNLGRATNFDVLERQDELKVAQLAYARAVVDYLNAIAVIDSLTGELMARYGVTVTPAPVTPAPTTTN